jgi:hypothetical protein
MSHLSILITLLIFSNFELVEFISKDTLQKLHYIMYITVVSK